MLFGAGNRLLSSLGDRNDLDVSSRCKKFAQTAKNDGVVVGKDHVIV